MSDNTVSIRVWGDFACFTRSERLTRHVDLRIEPHSFSRRDFENPDPFVREIITTGERIL